MDEKAVRESQVELSQGMCIADANLAGFVHGGVIMKLVDSAGGLAAIRHARGMVVTAAIDEMVFIEPIQLGSLVTVKASVNLVGHTSMEVGVRVETENILTGERVHASSAYLVFVAIDDDTGKPRPVPGLIAESPDEKRRMREARIRREARLARRASILEQRAAGDGDW
ncbi:MAG TPA: acyl-CoA thioesterase [Actinomycetota bacterium]|nr:acyl-CoA thioesterase [Actinomycetota bacterium]